MLVLTVEIMKAEVAAQVAVVGNFDPGLGNDVEKKSRIVLLKIRCSPGDELRKFRLQTVVAEDVVAKVQVPRLRDEMTVVRSWRPSHNLPNPIIERTKIAWIFESMPRAGTMFIFAHQSIKRFSDDTK